jgi:hypothetical protein
MTVIARVLFVAAAAGARLRGARLMHPRGRAFAGTLVTAPTGDGVRATGARLFDAHDRHRVTVRLSKATATPPGWPDVFGLAIRLGGRRRPLDLLLSSSNHRPVLRHLFLPARGPATFYSSLAAYRTARHRRLFLGARVDPGGTTATIAVATRFSRWHPAARLFLRRRLPGRVSARLAFNPVRHTRPDLRTVGWLHRLRDPVYRGSQHGTGR